MAMRSAFFVQLGVLAVWVVLGGVLGYLRAKADGRNYRSEAVVFFDPSLSGGEQSTGITSLRVLLTSDGVLQRAQRDGQLGKLFEYRDVPRLTETLRGRVSVRPQRSGPGAYRVVVHCRTAEAATPTAEAVLQAAQQELGELGAAMPAKYVEELKALVTLLEQRSDALQKANPGELSPEVPGDIQERLAYWDRQSELLRREIAWLQRQSAPAIAGDSGSSSSLGGAEANASLSPARGAEGPSGELQAMDRVVELRRQFLEPLLERQRELAKRFGPDHAELRDVRRRVAIVARLLSTSTPPPAEAIPLLVDEQVLLEQFGPAHPRVQEVRNKVKEILQHSTTEAARVGSLPPEASSRSGPYSAPDASASAPLREPPPSKELLAQKQAELDHAEHALHVARHDALLHQVRARVSALEEQLQAGRGRLAILSPPSSAAWDWSRDATASGVGAALGLLCGLLIGLIGKFVSLSIRTST